MSNIEPFLAAHPVLHTIKKGLIIFDSAEYINRKGKIKEKYFCLHISGIYILFQKSFSKQLQVSRFIPLVDLKKVFVTEKQLTFQSDTDKITIIHQKMLKIASKTETVYQALFDHPSMKLEMLIENKIKAAYDQHYFAYQPTNLLADRFIACILKCTQTFVESTVKETYDFLTTVSDILTISDIQMSNPYIQAIMQAFSLDTNIRELKLKNFAIDAFIPYMLQTAKYNATLNKVYLKNIDFSHPIKNVELLFDENNSINIRHFELMNCKFDLQPAATFFEEFSKYRPKVEYLSFKGCQFNTASLDSFFQTLFFSPCFHNLQYFKLENITGFDDLSFLIFQLVSSGWVLETHCLKYLVAKGCNLQLENLLPQVLQLDTEFNDLDLSHNNFLTPLKTKFEINQSFSSLILQDVNFGPGALLSLLKCLQKVQNKFSLDISRCVMNQESWNEFYSKASQIKIQNMTTLVFDGNDLNNDNIKSFCEFIHSLPILSNLSISNCVKKTNVQSVFPKLIELIQNKPFESITISSTPENALGVSMSDFLLNLVRKGCLKKLDISGQMVGENLLNQICQEMSSSLCDINFDGFNPTDAEAFLGTCENFLSRSFIKNAVWPASDVKNALQKSSPQLRNELQRRIQHMKTQFASKFGKNEKKPESIFDNCPKQSSGADSIDPISLSNSMTPKQGLFENYTQMSIYVKYDNETELLLKECKDIYGVDPIEKIFTDINRRTQVETLADQLE